jgi:hypothetical protein
METAASSGRTHGGKGPGRRGLGPLSRLQPRSLRAARIVPSEFIDESELLGLVVVDASVPVRDVELSVLLVPVDGGITVVLGDVVLGDVVVVVVVVLGELDIEPPVDPGVLLVELLGPPEVSCELVVVLCVCGGSVEPCVLLGVLVLGGVVVDWA